MIELVAKAIFKVSDNNGHHHPDYALAVNEVISNIEAGLLADNPKFDVFKFRKMAIEGK